MGAHVLRLLQDRLAPGDKLGLEPLNHRMVYCVTGAATSATAGLSANDAIYTDGATTLVAGEIGAHLLRFELLPAGTEIRSTLASALLLACDIALDDEEGYLMRCDRVDFPLAGIAYRHTHQGPGIRCLVQGRIEIESEGRTEAFKPFDAWFESGPEPVLARASDGEDTAFVRVMVLPASLLGKSSIRYVDPADQDKPKRQRYTIFQDQLISISKGT